MTAPRNDSLQSLLSKAGNLMFDVLTDNNIAFSAETDIPEKKIVLPDRLRNNIFMILKEGLHNIITHAGARQVTFRAYLKNSWCYIRLIDDGCGFSGETHDTGGSHGHGLSNMRRRAHESSIELLINSDPGRGTTISLSFQI
jgi:signal transduction histidine kinase